MNWKRVKLAVLTYQSGDYWIEKWPNGYQVWWRSRHLVSYRSLRDAKAYAEHHAKERV